MPNIRRKLAFEKHIWHGRLVLSFQSLHWLVAYAATTVINIAQRSNTLSDRIYANHIFFRISTIWTQIREKHAGLTNSEDWARNQSIASAITFKICINIPLLGFQDLTIYWFRNKKLIHSLGNFWHRYNMAPMRCVRWLRNDSRYCGKKIFNFQINPSYLLPFIVVYLLMILAESYAVVATSWVTVILKLVGVR